MPQRQRAVYVRKVEGGVSAPAIFAEPQAAVEHPLSSPTPIRAERRHLWPALLLSFAGVNCAFQIAWFWRYTAGNVNYDAISYIGIARHILDGHFRASLNGYWGPLFSWCIAGAGLFAHNLLLAARVVTIASFLACLPLLYLLTLRLWRSATVASFSVLCFTLARGVTASSVYFIGTDFLLTAAVLGYFTVLLGCFRKPDAGTWLTLGAVHGLAFLIKAFAMPWLMVSTVFAAALVNRRKPRRAVTSTALGMILPLIVWASWGMLLKSKYGYFTAGYQLRWNLLDDRTKMAADRAGLSVLTDTSRSNDEYMVVDNMYPSSSLWRVPIERHPVAREIWSREKQNLPQAIKQIFVLITPGGILALLFALARLVRTGRTEEMMWAVIVLCGTTTLVFAYCMLVFDARYLLPLVPLLVAIASPCLLPFGHVVSSKFVRFGPGPLFLASLIFLGVYHASPFRSIRRDYQAGLYSIASSLRQLPHCDRLVVIGDGRYPEHGIGWEAGIYSSFFAQCRMVGYSEQIPKASGGVIADIEKLRADSVLVFGNASDAKYRSLVDELQSRPLRFIDLRGSRSGPVGVVFAK